MKNNSIRNSSDTVRTLSLRDFHLDRQSAKSPDLDALIETKRQLEGLLFSDIDFAGEDGSHVLRTILRFQAEDGSFNLLDSFAIESDACIDFCIEPTYLCTAILMKAHMQDRDVCPGITIFTMESALRMCLLGHLHGHGYDIIRGYIRAVKYFIAADVKAFLQEYPDLCPEFTEMFLNVPNELNDLLSRFRFRFGLEEPYEKDVSLIHEYFSNTFVFVYGTLLSGQRNHDAFLSRSTNLGPAEIRGYEMYDLGSYPGILPGNGTVKGEIYAVDKSTLRSLDRLEGEGSLYFRRHTLAFLEDGTAVPVMVYVYLRSVTGCPRIYGLYGSDECTEDLAGEGSEPDAVDAAAYVWYACYGSNVNYERFLRYINDCTDRTPPAESRPFLFPCPLYFGKYTSTWHGAKAFLDLTGEGSAFGRIYRITEEQFDEIQRMEGSDYTRKVELGTIDGLPVLSFTDRDRNPNKLPSASYFLTILDGLCECWGDTLTRRDLALYLTEHILPQHCAYAAFTVRKSPHAISLREITRQTRMTDETAKYVMKSLLANEVVRADKRSKDYGFSFLDPDTLFYTTKGTRSRADARELLSAILEVVDPD